MKKVGLLGTFFTMEKDYLSKAFVANNIEVITPSKEDKEIVHHIIANELEYGIIKENSRSTLISVIKKNAGAKWYRSRNFRLHRITFSFE